LSETLTAPCIVYSALLNPAISSYIDYIWVQMNTF